MRTPFRCKCNGTVFNRIAEEESMEDTAEC